MLFLSLLYFLLIFTAFIDYRTVTVNASQELFSVNKGENYVIVKIYSCILLLDV